MPRPGPAMNARCPALLLLFLAARLAMAGGSSAQADMPPAPPSQEIPATATPAASAVVVVRASRELKVRLAKERLMNALARMASSCAYLDSYHALNSPVATAYMSDFELADDLSDSAYDTAATDPAQSTSRRRRHSGVAMPPLRNSDPVVPLGNDGCRPADRSLMAGRSSIVLRDASLAEGYAAFDRKDYALAFERFGTAWDKVGYDEAALMLARMYLDGLGTPKDSGTAIHWFELVADGRFDPWNDRLRFNPAHPFLMTTQIEAAIMLARIHERGIGVAPDRKQADAWYEKAVDFGFVPALDILGREALSGAGRDPDRAQARFKEAADAGYALAQYDLARMYYAGDGVARNLNLAGAYFDAAARAGLPEAMFAAGRMYDRGVNVAADPAKAIVYFKEAALKGNRDARFALGSYFYKGVVVGQDLATARAWFAAAARQGQPDAIYQLAAMMASGQGGMQDRAMAYAWFGRAARAGQEQAGAAQRELATALTAEERGRASAEAGPSSDGAD